MDYAPERPPYEAYAAITGTFAGLLAAAGAVGRLLDRDPQCQTALDLVVRGEAHWSEGEDPVEGGMAQAIGELVTCTRCAGTWVAGTRLHPAARAALRSPPDMVVRRRRQRLPAGWLLRSEGEGERARGGLGRRGRGRRAADSQSDDAGDRASYGLRRRDGGEHGSRPPCAEGRRSALARPPTCSSSPSSSGRAPSLASRLPPGKPKSAAPATSAAATNPVRAGEPVVTRTNQGSASHIICDPVVETTSAASSAASRRSASRPRQIGRAHV